MKDTKSPLAYNGNGTVLEAPSVSDSDNHYEVPGGGQKSSSPAMKSPGSMVPSGLLKQFSVIQEEGGSAGSTTDDDDAISRSSDGSVTWVTSCQRRGKTWCSHYSSQITKVVLLLLLIGYSIYFGYAIHYSLELAEILIYLTIIVVLCIIYTFVRDTFGDTISQKCFDPVGEWIESRWSTLQWIVFPALLIGLVCYLSFGVVTEIKQLQSLSGIIVFISITYITSKHPDRIRWRPVIWGYALQFVMGVFVLRWEFGYRFVKFLGDEITKFINYAYDGAATVYGDPFMVFHPFAFMGLSMIIYMGAVMSVLYYLGITQSLAGKMAWLMQKSMGTTAIETLGVASNIFLNGMDTMLMLRAYLDLLTKSEFHCFLVGGHSTIAGFVFGLFVLFGAPPQHLISGAVMSAPAVIAICKLNYPETRESITKRVEDVTLAKGCETNVFEACANGASIAGKTVAAVIVNYIAFLGLLAWVNATLAWLGERVGYDELSFEEICSYLFWPLALIIGVDISDCKNVAKLIGIKVFTTEILAYQELGVDYRNGLISDRSRTIATYALCGFSSISTLAIAVGVWSSLCPQRVPMMASMMLRALINANISCFMTACIAGLMYREDLVIPDPDGNPIIAAILGWLPSYKDLMALVGM